MPFPVEVKWVDAMEREMGLKFPPLYKAKLLKENGGELRTRSDGWQLYPVFDKSDRKRIARTCNSIAHETKKDRERSRFPKDAVSIGSNGGGDQLVLLPQETGSSQFSDAIFWWDHETGRVTKIGDDVVEITVADSDAEEEN